VIQD